MEKNGEQLHSEQEMLEMALDPHGSEKDQTSEKCRRLTGTLKFSSYDDVSGSDSAYSGAGEARGSQLTLAGYGTDIRLRTAVGSLRDSLPSPTAHETRTRALDASPTHALSLLISTIYMYK